MEEKAPYTTKAMEAQTSKLRARALAQLDALEKWQLHELLRFIEWLAARGTARAA